MKSLSLITLVFTLLAVSCLQGQSTRTLESFKSLDVSGSITIEIVKSNTTKADITILKGEAEDLMTEVTGSTLKVNFAKESGNSWGGGAKARITLYTDRLESVEASAGAAIESDASWNSKNLSLGASSGARIYLTSETSNAKASASSGARITVLGASESLNVSCSSGATIDASGMKSQGVNAECSSGGSIKVHAVARLKADASSGGSIKYKGNPADTDIKKDKYSGGNVSAM